MPDLICLIPNHGYDDDDEIFVSWLNGNYFVVDTDLNTFNRAFKISETVGGSPVQYIDTITDGYVRMVTETSSTIISGLDHLEGETVTVTSGGDVIGAFVVVGGSITLDTSLTTFQTGLPYTCKIRTTRLAAPQEPGALQSRQKKISRATLRHSKTKGAKIGQEYPVRSNADELVMTEFTEDVNAVFDTDSRDIPISVPGGIATDGYVVIKSETPNPMTVISAVIEYSVEETR